MPRPTRASKHVDKLLTNLSIKYVNPDNAYIAAEVFAPVKVTKQSDRYMKYDKEAWFIDEAEERAPGTESAGGDYDVDTTPTYFCRKWAFHTNVTEEDRVNTDAPMDADEDATAYVTEKVMLRREIQWASTFFKTGVWSADWTGAAAENLPAKELKYWSSSGSTPSKDVKNRNTEMQEATAKRCNVGILGRKVYDVLTEHADVVDRIKYTQTGFATLQLLQQYLEIPQLYIGNAVKNTANKGQTMVGDYIISEKSFLMIYRNPRPAIKQPSAGYTFVWTGLLGANALGGRINRFNTPTKGIGTQRIEAEFAYDMKLVGSDLGIFFSNIVQ